MLGVLSTYITFRNVYIRHKDKIKSTVSFLFKFIDDLKGSVIVTMYDYSICFRNRIKCAYTYNVSLPPPSGGAIITLMVVFILILSLPRCGTEQIIYIYIYIKHNICVSSDIVSIYITWLQTYYRTQTHTVRASLSVCLSV